MRITKFFAKSRGISATEVVFAAVISAMVIASIFSVWIFGYRSWMSESNRTVMRVEVMEALETIREDLRLSSLTDMSFYPEGPGPYTAISLPKANPDGNGYLTIDLDANIVWDETIIYHLFTEADGTKTLRRTVIDPRDNNMTENQRYAQLTSVITTGTGGAGSSTDTAFLPDVDTFEISSLSPIVDFYDPSSTPIRVGKVVFGWVKLEPGDHDIRFEVTGKNASSSGFSLGIDSISIEPAGSIREMEYYDTAGLLTASGGSTLQVNNSLWSNNSYLEFQASGVGSYMEMTDYYDLWRESGFESVGLNNTERIDDEVRIALDIPEDIDEGGVSWLSYMQSGDTVQTGRDGTLPGSGFTPITLRMIVTSDNISREGDLIRVSFEAPSTAPITINNAYITKRDPSGGPNGLANQIPSSLDLEDYHRHQQLFFKDANTGVIGESVTIPAGEKVWSEWSGFPIRGDSDYLISLYIHDITSVDSVYWQGEDTTTRTYYIELDDATKAGSPDWSMETPLVSQNMFCVDSINVTDIDGGVESQVFDTTLSSPSYSSISWQQNQPSGTGVKVKARSSSNEDMVGAIDWSLVAPSTVDGSNRYVQFAAELTTAPFWQADSATLSYTEYVQDQVSSYPVYNFPVSGGVPYTTQLGTPWIDDVEIRWPGEEKTCVITGYIAKENDYGQAKVIVDGVDLMKVLSVYIKRSDTIQGVAVDEEKYIEMEPRNTGK